MPLLCAIAIVRPEMKVIRGDSSVFLPGSSLQSAQASKNYNLILFRTILHPPDSFVSKNEGMAEHAPCSVALQAQALTFPASVSRHDNRRRMIGTPPFPWLKLLARGLNDRSGAYGTVARGPSRLQKFGRGR